ncbi:hypothetical protein GQ457_08G031580 [Hibiscus cannabinus]
MADFLLSKLGKLTFTVEEQDAVVVTPDAVAIPAEDFACSLVGKVISPPPPLMAADLLGNFAPSGETTSEVLGKRGPWDFQKYWFALEQADPNRTIHDYSFQHMCIWVRIHNIQLSLMTAALARALGASVGKVIMTDTRLEDGNMGEFMRVRVSFDTSKPLRRCVVLSRPDAKASMCPLQYERLPLFCHGCGLIGHSVLACPATPKVEGQKFQYGAWLHAPLPKRSASRPCGRLYVIDDDTDAPEMVDSASEGPSVPPDSTRTAAPALAPEVPVVAAPVTQTPPAPVATPDANLRGPSASSETADLVGEAVDDASPDQDASEAADGRSTPDDAPYDPMRDCVLLADLTGVIQANGEDLVNEAIPKATDSIIREVAASILGVSASPDAVVVSSRPPPMPVTSLAKPGLSKSAPAGSRRAAMPMVPEHHEFDEWCAAQSRTPAAQEEKLIKTLRQHKEALGWTIADIKGISPTICMHKILLEDNHKPTVDAQRRLNQAMKDVVRKEVLKWLDAGIIYPISDSEWVSPVQCVPKKGGITVVSNEKNELIPTRTITGWRVCMDYWKLNKATINDHFPLPFIDQMLDRLVEKQFYCFLDGYSGYNQIAIAPEDQSKTTFTCPYGTFAFRRMPFGLCNAPATFQRCMTAIFSDLNEDCLEIFMDDFSTFGENFDNCLSNLEKVLKRCKETNLVLNWEKCHFMVDEGIVLGHKISSKGMEVDKAKIEVISKLPPLTTVKGIHSFLGHAGFYRRFIEDFSKITKPLCSLLEQGRQFKFNEDCTKAFNLLK